MAKPKLFDVVRLDTGETGDIIEVFDNGEAYMVEFADADGRTIDTPIIEADRISEIIYTA